jgi:hypothetical protein
MLWDQQRADELTSLTWILVLQDCKMMKIHYEPPAFIIIITTNNNVNSWEDLPRGNACSLWVSVNSEAIKSDNKFIAGLLVALSD